MTKRFSLAAIAAAASLSVSAVSAQVNLSAETASPGGMVYLVPATLAEVASSAGVANIQLKDGQTLTNSVQNVAEGKTDIAATPYILPFLLSRGVGPYSKIGKEKGAELAGNLRALYPYTLGIFFLYAYDAKNIGGWEGIKGHKILNGPPRGAAAVNSRSIIQIVTGYKPDADYESVTVNWGQASQTISDGSVDAAVLPEYFPGARPTEVSAAGAMTAWSIPKAAYEGEAMQKYLKAPGSAPWEMSVADAQNLGDNWTIVSDDDVFRGMATIGGDIVHKDLDEELVYKLVKLHIDNLDLMKSKAPFASNAGLAVLDQVKSGMCGANPLKYHPGAVRAWEEAGYTVPDCAKP